MRSKVIVVGFIAVVGAVLAEGAVVSKPLPVPPGPALGFMEVPAAESGVTCSNIVAQETARNHVTLIASGVAVADVDGDGLADLYFCRLDAPSVLYRNLGDWKFEDITARAGVGCAGRQNIGAAFADVDGDGDADLLATARGGPNALFRNDGHGVFREDAAFPGAASTAGSTSLALADADGDGDLDLYVCNYRAKAYGDDHLPNQPDPWRDGNMRKMLANEPVDPAFAAQFYVDRGEVQEKGEQDVFYLNDGQGRFTAANDRFGKTFLAPGPLDGWGLAAQFRDIDLDGDPDLYVCNDFHTPDRLWINDGSAHFREAPPLALRKTSYYSMAVDFADIDLDGDWDGFVADMLSRDHARRKRQMGNMRSTAPQTDNHGPQPQVMQNTFFLNRGDSTFAECSSYAGLKASEWTWGAVFEDVDLDGYPDLLCSSGMLHDWMDADTADALATPSATLDDVREARTKYAPLRTRNLLFRNKGDWTFEEIGQKAGLLREEISGGLALADLDNDGDQDAVFSNTGAPAELYRNASSAARIAVRLRGRVPNTSAVGARVRLVGQRAQLREIVCGGRYASAGGTDLQFAAPAEWGPFTLEVTWRNGRRTQVQEVVANQRYVVTEDDTAQLPPKADQVVRVPLFTDVTSMLGHGHRENIFDDFAVQPLLPNTLSRLGPGVGWIDLDGDGDDDAVVGGSRGHAIALFGNHGKGRLGELTIRNDPFRLELDATAIVPLPAPEGAPMLLAGLSLHEHPRSELAGRLYAGQRGAWVSLATLRSLRDATGPVTAFDADGDHQLDAFLGGRVQPGRYPAACDSHLLFDVAGGAATNGWQASLRGLGLVSGSVAADFNGDGRVDLALACEWGPVQLLLNTGEGFTNATTAWGLAERTGWWNSVQVGDFNGDGRLDLVAGNWGENSKYGHTPKSGRPLEIYHGDFDGNGTWDIVEAHVDKFTQKLVPERGLSCSSRAMPFVRQRTPTFRLFGDAALSEIYGNVLSQAAVVRCTELRHLLLLNRGDRFEAIPLPAEAQLSTVFGVNVADFDGDGCDDVFLAQNFFSMQVEAPRNDAGRGLLLRGNGQGGLLPVDARDSGLFIYSEQRGSAVSDYDRDGRVDLLVAQNDQRTRLFRNAAAKPGLRVRLAGPPGNPQGFGARVRALPKVGAAPMRVVAAGSGYWSVDSPVLVITSPTPFAELEVLWPQPGGARRQTVPVPPGVLEMTVAWSKDPA